LKKFLTVLVLLVLAAGAAADELIVTDVVLVDPVRRELRPAELHIVDGIVARVAAPGGLDVPGDTERWSAEGAFAMPPMLDASTFSSTQVSPGHRDALGPEDARKLFLSFGVHHFVDLAGGIGSLRGGPVMTAVGGVGLEIPGAIELDGEAEARATVRRLLDDARPPHRLSVIFDRGRNRRGLDDQLLAAVLDEAGEVPVGVYVGTWRDAIEALDAGANWILQIPPGPPPEAVLERVARLRPAWTPTVAVGTDFMVLMAEPELRESPALARSLPEPMRADYGEVRVPQSRLTEARLQNQDRLAALAALHEAGALLVAGSQSGGLGTAHGFTYVRELQAWRDAGIDPWEVIAAATVHGAARLGVGGGTWEGARADFTLHAASPVDSIGVLADPRVVFAAGHRATPSDLAAAVAHALTEDVPDNPLPGESRWSLLILAVVGFAVLLGIRQLIRRAAARALES
jgi:hypothetical protein